MAYGALCWNTHHHLACILILNTDGIAALATVSILQATTAAVEAASQQQQGGSNGQSGLQAAVSVLKDINRIVVNARTCLQCKQQCSGRGGQLVEPNPVCTTPQEVVQKCVCSVPPGSSQPAAQAAAGPGPGTPGASGH